MFEHALMGLTVEGLTVFGFPRAALEERFGTGLIDEIAIEEPDLGQHQTDAVAISLKPSWFHLMHVDAQAQGTIIDT